MLSAGTEHGKFIFVNEFQLVLVYTEIPLTPDTPASNERSEFRTTFGGMKCWGFGATLLSRFSKP